MKKTHKKHWWKIGLASVAGIGLVSAVAASAVACSSTNNNNNNWEQYLNTFNYQSDANVTKLSEQLTAKELNIFNVPLNSVIQTEFSEAYQMQNVPVQSQPFFATQILKNINNLTNNSAFNAAIITLVKNYVIQANLSLPSNFDWNNVGIASFSPMILNQLPNNYSAMFYLSYKENNTEVVSCTPLYLTNLLTNKSNIIAQTILNHKSSFVANANLLKLSYAELLNPNSLSLFSNVLQSYFQANNLDNNLGFSVNIKDINVTQILPVLLSDDTYGVYAYISYQTSNNSFASTYPILFTGFTNFPPQNALSSTIKSIFKNSNGLNTSITLNYQQAGQTNNNFAPYLAYVSHPNSISNSNYFSLFANAISRFMIGHNIVLPTSANANTQTFIDNYNILGVNGVQTINNDTFLVFIEYKNPLTNNKIPANFPILVKGNYKSPVDLVSSSIIKLTNNLQEPTSINQPLPSSNLSELFSFKNFNYFNSFLKEDTQNENVMNFVNNNLPKVYDLSDYNTYQVLPDFSSNGEYAYIRPQLSRTFNIQNQSVFSQSVDIFSLLIKVKI